MEVCDNGGNNSNDADDSLASNWFYTNWYKLRPVRELYKLYLTCRQQRSNLLLNITPTAEGFISDEIVAQLKIQKALIDQKQTNYNHRRPYPTTCIILVY